MNVEASVVNVMHGRSHHSCVYIWCQDHEEALRRQGQLAQQLLAARVRLAQLHHGGSVDVVGGGDGSGSGSDHADGSERGRIGGGDAWSKARHTDAEQMCRRLLDANTLLMTKLERAAATSSSAND